MDTIEYLTPPVIEEILKQQRIILEIQKEILKVMAQPIMISREKKDG